jgi:hypothetical protein
MGGHVASAAMINLTFPVAEALSAWGEAKRAVEKIIARAMIPKRDITRRIDIDDLLEKKT